VTAPLAKASGFLEHAQLEALRSTGHRPDPPRSREDIEGCIVIPMKRQATGRTVVPANGEFLVDLRPAPAAGLACPSGIDLHHCDTGSFGLVSQGRQERRPSDVCNRTGQPAVPHHPRDVEALHRDEASATDQRNGCLVSMVLPTATNLRVYRPKLLHGLSAVVATLLLSADGTPCAAQLRKGFLEVPGVGLVDAIGVGQEVLQPYVDPDLGADLRGDGDVSRFAGERDVPLVSFTKDRDRLDRPLDGSVEVDLDFANVLDVEAVAGQSDTVKVGGKGDGIEVVSALEARISGLLFGLDSPEKRLKGAVKTQQGGLDAAKVRLGVPSILPATFLEPPGLVLVGQGSVLDLVSHLAVEECGVVDVTVRVECDAQLADLVRRGVQTVLEGTVHLRLPLLGDVLLDCLLGNKPNAPYVIASTSL
jgi:hypothetical protein